MSTLIECSRATTLILVSHSVCRPFDYSGKKMLGEDAMKKLFWAEVSKANDTKGYGQFGGTPGGVCGSGKNKKDMWDRATSKPGGRYQAAFPDDWENRVWARVKAKHVSVRELIDHVQAEGVRIFKVSRFCLCQMI